LTSVTSQSAAPDAPGAYEIRYLPCSADLVLFSIAIKVT